MKNNIDEDIKILEELAIKKYDDKLLNTLDMVTEEDDVYILSIFERQAIENVLSELESYKGKIIHLSDEEYRKVIDNAQKDIKSELETYRRIANMNLKDSEEFKNNMCEHRCPMKSHYEEELEIFKTEHKIMKRILVKHNLWETLLNDDEFIEHLNKEI